LTGRDEWLKKIVIPSSSIRRMALELDVLGVRLADLFPDLHHLAREIKNVHRPSTP
jgi:hypothetical protein